MLRNQFEVAKACNTLTKELFNLKEGENFIITADTESDPQVVNSTAAAAFSIGARPMVVWVPAHKGKGKEADKVLPLATLTAALKEADAWAEYSQLLYSTPYNVAMKENKKLRHMNLVGMDADMMTRCITRVDSSTLKDFLNKIADLTRNAKHVRITTPAGTDVEFDNKKISGGKPDPNYPVNANVGYAHVPGSHMLSGQIGWSPALETINGTIVFDGSISNGCSDTLLEEPIFLTIKAGEIIKVDGGKQAREFESWMKSFNHPQMLKMAHVCYGFNPGAKLTGRVVEDERVWGCTEWGIGHIGSLLIKPDGVNGPSHTDGICLESSVWLDGVQIMDKGHLLDPELKKLAEKFGKV